MIDLKPNITVTSRNVNGFNPYNYMGKISKVSYKVRPTIWYIKGFPGGSDSKESACNAGDLGSMLGLGRCPGEGNGYQYSCLENSVDRGAWQATDHGVTKSLA